MKKILSIGLLIVTVFILSGCQEVDNFLSWVQNPTQEIINNDDTDENDTCNLECENEIIIEEKIIYEEIIIYEEVIVYEEKIVYEEVIVYEEKIVYIDEGVFDKLIETRDAIRYANLFVEVDQYKKGIGNATTKVGTSTGSAFIFYQDGNTFYALTNYHVLFFDDDIIKIDIRVSPLSNEVYEATLVAYDKDNDLALISFESTSTAFNILDIHARKDINLASGEFLLAVGNPKGVRHMVTFGEYIDMRTIANVTYPVIYHSAIIHSGNSGGALVDIDGNLVGINTWSAQDSDVRNFAIPLSIIYAFLDEVMIEY
ncbi:MAG: S1C family serine protease [Candidatus Izemoplasmataceae bacterium]